MKININNSDMAKGFLAGTILGIISGACAAKLYLETKIREEVAIQISSIENSYEAAIALRDAKERLQIDIQAEIDRASAASVDGFVKFEDGHIVPLTPKVGLEKVDNATDVIGLDKPIETVEAPNYLGEVSNPYHEALVATETVPDVPREEGVADTGVEYIDEESYLDEDGYSKSKVDILLDDGDPIFIMDGDKIDDWEKRIGESILVDMFRLCPPGTEPVLYVRNHRTDEDYEVVRVEP